jgi:hypothetical protein
VIVFRVFVVVVVQFHVVGELIQFDVNEDVLVLLLVLQNL